MNVAPLTGADVDDTAKGILSLNMLKGKHGTIEVDPMIEMFEAETHFRTYPAERDPSFSANCNVLLALLHHPDKSRYLSQVEKVVQFLCEYWWSNDNNVTDKWVCTI